MENLILIHTENIPPVTHHDEDHEEGNDKDYDDYNAPNTRTVDETTRPSFMDKQATSTEWLKQKVTRDKLAAMYRHLSITRDIDLTNLDRFNYTKNTKNGTTILEFYNEDKWVLLKNQTGEFLTPK